MTREELKTLLYQLHGCSYLNEQSIIHSRKCGCFHCGSIFAPEEVKEWCDSDHIDDRTALCPRCGIDSVLGDDCGIEITAEMLVLMNYQFFGQGLDNVKILGLEE